MPEELRPILEREMEVYAGFLEHTDHHVGRLVDAIEELGILDDTLIYYIIGDNGASAEGTIQGAFNEMANFNGMAALETPEFCSPSSTSWEHRPLQPLCRGLGLGDGHALPVDQTGGLALGWHPQRHHRPLAGGYRAGGLRSQFCHVIDVAPTILEAAGIPEPLSVNGVQHRPSRGPACSTASTMPRPPNGTTSSTSRCSATGASITRAGAPSPSTGHRGSGWCKDAPPSMTTSGSCTTASKDWTQADDLSAELPEKLHDLQRLWLIEAVKYNVLPH